MADCLCNTVVLRRIFERFSSEELRELSLVNKLWKCEAQSVMRKRGHMTAYVESSGSDRHPEVDAFISDLKQMNPVPFSGISIDIWIAPIHSPVKTPALDFDKLEGVVLDLPTLKTVSVKLGGSWRSNMASTGVLLTKKLLQDSSTFLEELELELHDGHEYFMQEVIQDFTFPRLQILKLGENNFGLDDAAYEHYMKAILSRAPNLKVLHSNYSINLLLSVLDGRSVMAVYGFVTAPFEEVPEDLISAINFESIRLEYTGPEFDFERFNRIAPMLLQQSCTTTLCCVWLDAVLAIPLMTYEIRLENVKEFMMDIAHGRLELTEPRILTIVKNFDFTRIFPNVFVVNMQSGFNTHELSSDHMNAIIEQANAVHREPMLDRAANIKELVLKWHSSDIAAEFCNEMFPSIEKLEIIRPLCAPGDVPFGSFWNWSDLKELEIQGEVLPMTGNLDSVFCGIFPEEVEELISKDDEYLKRVNIVPVMPALTCSRNLRILSLRHRHHPEDPFGDPMFMFSKVTALLAFARRPALTVHVHITALEDPPEMTHLEPYVRVTSDLLEDVESDD